VTALVWQRFDECCKSPLAVTHTHENAKHGTRTLPTPAVPRAAGTNRKACYRVPGHSALIHVVRQADPDLREQAAAYTVEHVARTRAIQRRDALLATLCERERFIQRGFDFQEAELASARVRQSEKARTGNTAAVKALKDIKEQQRTLAQRRQQGEAQGLEPAAGQEHGARSAPIQARFLSLAADSSPWPSDLAATQTVKLQLATAVTGAGAVAGGAAGSASRGWTEVVAESKRLVAETELEPSGMQDLADLMPDLLEIKNEFNAPLSF
jgi:hypothetical protein